jgi:hypothetical protein
MPSMAFLMLRSRRSRMYGLNGARTELCGGAQGNLRPYRDPFAALQRFGPVREGLLL